MPSNNSTQHRRYHIGNDFDFNRYIRTIYGFISSLISQENLRLATMFIYQDSEGRPYGQYQLEDELKQKTDFGNEWEFLSDHKLYLYEESLDDEEKERFSIRRINQAYYSHSNPEVILGELGAFNLSEYFQELSYGKFVHVSETDFTHAPHTDENFVKAEGILVRTLLKDLNTQTGYYQPLPIIAFGDLVGMTYFVYDADKLKGWDVKDLKTYKRLIVLQLTREYEKIVLDRRLKWFAPKPEDPLEGYQEIFADLGMIYKFSNRLEKPRPLITQNSFLQELGYETYYRNFASVYIEEAKLVNTSYRTQVRSAIISIIVDSFAHNVGAHSLVAMKWWEENRFKTLDKQIPLFPEADIVLHHEISSDDLFEYGKMDPFYMEMSRSESAQSDHYVSLMDVFRKMNRKRQNSILQFKKKGTEEVIAQIPIPLNATFNYYEFLRNKSAFWSGVTRDILFSGRLRNWTHLIRDFLRNSFFLGTVAHSEGINQIHFYLEIVNLDGTIRCTGKYAEVNLKVIQKEQFELDLIKKDLDAEKSLSSEYAFLLPGDQYKILAEELKNLDPVFLPSEMIGQQAFYNILENTLRNIKHYQKSLDKIREIGIRFYLSIQEVPFVERSGEEKETELKLYKVGTWLHHEQDLVEKYLEKDSNETLKKDFKETKEITVIDRHTRQLKQRILDESGKVRLGGSSQDKVCAAMLFNNTFGSIEDRGESVPRRHYYPYIFPASEPYTENRIADDTIQDEVLHIISNKKIRAATSKERMDKYEKEANEYREKLKAQGDKGIVKKYFHVWKGQDFKWVKEDFNAENENLTRFRVVAVDQYKRGEEILNYDQAIGELRKQGIMRVIKADTHMKTLNGDDKLYQYAMAQWLGFWLQGQQNRLGKTGLKLLKKSGSEWKPIGLIELIRTSGKGFEVTYNNASEIEERLKNRKLSKTELEGFPELKFMHGISDNKESKAACRIRSHCSLMTYIYPETKFEDFDKVTSAKVKADKMLETVCTRIVVFDNRMYSRLPKTQVRELDKDDNIIRDQLGLQVYPERPGRFMNNRKSFLRDCNVLVIHLSLLEWIWKDEITRVPYKESEVKDFFEKEIKQFYKETFDNKELPENFLLVITSGRGRGDWEEMEIPADKRITFRPIEALIDAVEDGLTMRDDFQIKHNLCNLIFGS